MNTTAHVLLGGVALHRDRAHWLAVSLGGLLPDLPMFVFYGLQRLALGRSEREVWGTLYYEPAWQAFFDAFNSLPLIAVAAALAAWVGHRPTLLLSLSMGIHAIADFFVHREDGHRHFFPLSDARFISPVSYWDPAHHGLIFSAFEALFVLGATAWFVRKGPPAWRRLALVLGGGHVAFGLFAAITWGGLF